MKQMFFADYATIKGVLWQQFLLSIGVTLFVAFFIGNPFMVIPMIGVMIPLYGIITLVTYDGQHGWEGYRLTLPISRSQTVKGRYVFILVMTVASILIGVVVHGVLILGAPLWSMLPLEEGFAEQLMEVAADSQILSAVAVAALFIVLVIASIMFPLSFRFGMSKAVQWVPLVIVVLFLGVVGLLEYFGPQLLVGFFEWVALPQNTFIVLAAGMGLCCLVYVASALLTARLYRSREL